MSPGKVEESAAAESVVARFAFAVSYFPVFHTLTRTIPRLFPMFTFTFCLHYNFVTIYAGKKTMSKTNPNLLNALLWNLREMTSLIKLIRGKIGDVKCNSWRHPLQLCGELDVLQLLEDNKDCDRYTYLLELTFDRLIYTLNLIVKYLENCDALSKFKPGKNVERPRNLSMASILYMIWDRIQARCETMIESAKSAYCEGLTISSFTQSDITSISSCLTCELAQNLVTQIVLKMENYFGDDASSSAILTERKLMKEKLIGTSNCSAMMAWVNAVLKDLSVIQEETERLKVDNRRLKSRIDSGEANLMTKMKKHEEETRTLQRLHRESEDKVKGLEWELKILRQDRQKQKEESTDLKSKYTELGRSLLESELRKRSLEEKLIKRERTEWERDSELKAKLESEVKWKESAQAEMETLKSSLADMKAQLAEENSRCSALEMKANQAGEKIRELSEENARLQATIHDKQLEIDKFVKKFLEAFPDISDDSKNIYKGTGDPVTDMRHQIEANKLRIIQLTAQNENLTQTINRIEAMKK